MKILIDTNILISASLFPDSLPARAYYLAVCPPNKGIVCDQNIDEFRAVYNRKFPHKLSVMEHFLAQALLTLQVVSTPVDVESKESEIRDVKDRPILRAAIKANVDAILTGDKDFLESGIEKPKIYTAREFIDLSEGKVQN